MTRTRRIVTWTALAIGAILVGLIGVVLAPQTPSFSRLDPANPGPIGARAVAELLRSQGVEVIVTGSRADAAAALRGGGTLVLADPWTLTDDAVGLLVADATDVVLIDPVSRTLRLLLPGASPAGYGTGTAEPDCALPDAMRAGPVGLFAVYAGDADLTRCYPSGDGWALLVAEHGDGRRVAVDGTLLSNQHLADAGNAALAMNLLGRQARLVWYVPSLEDADVTGDPTLADVTPPWVNASLVLLGIAAVAAAVWRGRRFGPLVNERLPVTVRVAETLEGRAQLYRRGRDAPHAAAALRADALRALARSLGLGTGAGAKDTSAASAALLAIDQRVVHDLLAGAPPTTDTDLIDLSDRLHDLVTAVHAAVRAERTAP